MDGYIAALTIQDITGLNLYECTEIDWSTAEEFFEQWDATIQNLPDTFEKIVNSDLSESDKIGLIEKYGVYGQEFLELQGPVIENDKMHGAESGGKTLEPLYIINKETYTFLHKRYPRMQFIPIFRSV